jgi:hypothetical protein
MRYSNIVRVENAVSKKWHKNREEQDSAKNEHKPACHQVPEWSCLYTPSTQSTPEENQHRADEYKYWHRQLRISKWLNWITGCAAFVGFLGLIYLRGQLNVMKDSLKQQQDTFGITERAWISMWGSGFFYITDQQGIPRADSSVIIKNTGVSPAFTVHVWRCAQVRDNPPVIDQEPESVPPCIAQDLGIVGSGVPVSFEVPDVTQPIAKDSLPKTVFGPGRHFYVWGKVTYRVFGITGSEHFTSFCLINGSPGNGFGPCAKGNDAD